MLPVVLSEDFSSGSALEGVRFVHPFDSAFQLDAWLSSHSVSVFILTRSSDQALVEPLLPTDRLLVDGVTGMIWFVGWPFRCG